MTDDIEEVRAAENRRYQAMLDGDVTLLEELCSPDLVYTHSFGERDTKESYLDKVRSGYFVYEEIDHPVSRILLVGDSAIVVGDMRAQVINDGVRRVLNNSAMAVWGRANGTWRFLAYQPTPYPSDEP